VPSFSQLSSAHTKSDAAPPGESGGPGNISDSGAMHRVLEEQRLLFQQARLKRLRFAAGLRLSCHSVYGENAKAETQIGKLSES
jgi:hypothetical protein